MGIATSCGWFDDKAPPNGEFYESQNAAQLCQINPAEISQILEKDISKQLWCIQANLEEFSKNVKVQNRNSIQQRELNKFVRSLFGAEASGYIDGMIILFQVNTVLVQDQKSRLNMRNIRSLFNSLVILNKLAVELNITFQGVTPENFIKKKQALMKITRELTDNLAKTIGTRGRDDRHFDIYELTDRLNDKLNADNQNDSDRIVRIKSFFRIKSLLVGGERNILTAAEFRRLLPKFHILAGVIFDLVAKPADYYDSVADEYRHLRGIMRNLEQIFEDVENENSVVLTLDELKEIAREIGFEETYTKYEFAVESFHRNVLLAEGRDVTHRDIKKMVATFRFLFPLFEAYYQVAPLPEDLNEKSIDVRKDYLSKIQMGIEEWRINALTLKNHKYLPEEIKLGAFLEDIKNSDLVEEYDPEFIMNILKMKKLFFQGDQDIWSKENLFTLIDKAYELMTVAFTTVYVDDIYGVEISDRYKLLKENMGSLKNLLVSKGRNAALITFEELLNIIDTWQDAVTALDFLPAVKNVWPRIFDHHREEVTLRDGMKILDHAYDLFQELEFNHKTVELKPELMKVNDVVKFISYPREDYYRSLGAAKFYYLSHRFGHIMEKHRYYINDQNKAIFDYDIVRTTKGITTFTSLRYILEILMGAYGRTTAITPKAIEMTTEQVDTLLKEFQSVLAPFGLWTKNIGTFARNTILMADLFQEVSNGNMKLDLVEMIDYASMVLAALDMTNYALENFQPKHAGDDGCQNVGTKEEPAYDVPCYRENFIDFLLNRFQFKKYLPNLNRYVNENSEQDVLNFLTFTEKFARDYPDDSIPMAKRDFALLIGSMLSIESVLLRYDVNRNNKIDRDELDKAFLLFRDALIALVPELQDGNEKYAHSAFLYLVKYQEKPSKWDLALFHYTPFGIGKDISAQRLSIGTILYYLTLQNSQE